MLNLFVKHWVQSAMVTGNGQPGPDQGEHARAKIPLNLV